MKQREIKFRAWDKKEKEWIKNYIPKQGWLNFNIDNGILKIISDNIDLVQFTGLHDKNGKEIYEGDIVNWYFSEEMQEAKRKGRADIPKMEKQGYVYLLKSKEGDEKKIQFKNWKIKWSNSKNGWLIPDSWYVAEIIGNIYESPELLNDK